MCLKPPILILLSIALFFIALDFSYTCVLSLIKLIIEGKNDVAVVVVQSLSRVQLCDLMDCSMPSSPVLHNLPEFAQVHVY